MIEHPSRTASRSPVRYFIALVLGATMILAWLCTPAHALQFQVTDHGHFAGQVATLIPATGSPTSFVLLQPNTSVSVSINPQTQLTGQSAEANVEGLVRDDYAVVNARRIEGRWVATTITYDVEPVPPLRTISGSVVKISPNGRRVNVRLDAGGNRAIVIGRMARFRLDNHLVDPPPILFKGEPIQLVVNKTPGSWIALEVDVRSVL
jgi:hypothetical protein